VTWLVLPSILGVRFEHLAQLAREGFWLTCISEFVA
jgi:hypothetical protein